MEVGSKGARRLRVLIATFSPACDCSGGGEAIQASLPYSSCTAPLLTAVPGGSLQPKRSLCKRCTLDPIADKFSKRDKK